MESDSRLASTSLSESRRGSPDASRAEPSSQIEALFARFLAIYGARFSRLWAGADPDEVKRVWAMELMRFEPDQVGRAVDRCAREVENPPNLPEFVRLVRECYVAPVRAALDSYRLTYAPDPVELEVNREFPREAAPPWLYWAKRILRLEQRGQKQYIRAVQLAQEALRVKDLAEFAAKYPMASQ